MRICYTIQLKNPLFIEDHWPMPFMDGEMRMIESGGKVSALEIIFCGKPVSYSPNLELTPNLESKAQISTRDPVFAFADQILKSAFSYLQCYFDVEIRTDALKIEYIPETDEEKSTIQVSFYETKRNNSLHPLPYDLLTRAVMVSESSASPDFEATLIHAARRAAMEKNYIDSFRYSFLLIESLYGGGKFKTEQLRDALKASPEFVGFISNALQEPTSRPATPSSTTTLLKSSPPPNAVIDHIVERRGFYFHGNIKRKDAWKPYDQSAAEALCYLALDIAGQISHEAAAPMFVPELTQRHYDAARKVGAIMSMTVKFTYREPHDQFDREGGLNINVPGTKVSGKMARYVAQQFLERFDHVTPSATLKTASCHVKGTDQKVFELRLFGGA